MIFSGIDLVEINRFSRLDSPIRKRFFFRVFCSRAHEIAKELHIQQWSISITHTKKTAAAIAVAAAGIE